jgi:hypothetical protein
MLTGQQLVQQHAERVHVGRGGNRSAGDLLGSGVLRRHRRAVLARQQASIRSCSASSNSFAMLKSSSLTCPLAVDQDVRRLQIAMNDQVGVRVRHRRLHVEKQPDPLFDAEAFFVAIAVDVTAVDVLEHQVGLAGRRHAGVDQPRDVRMSEPRENGAFPA